MNDLYQWQPIETAPVGVRLLVKVKASDEDVFYVAEHYYEDDWVYGEYVTGEVTYEMRYSTAQLLCKPYAWRPLT